MNYLNQMPTIRWIDDRFIVLDAELTTQAALSLIKKSRVQWIVIVQRDRGNSFWYVFKVKEVLGILTRASPGLTIKRSSLLYKTLRSYPFLGKREQIMKRTRDLAGARHVILIDEATERVKGIGEIQHHLFSAGGPMDRSAPTSRRKRLRQQGDSLFVRKAGKKATKKAVAKNRITDQSYESRKSDGWSSPTRRLQKYNVVPVFFATDREVAEEDRGDNCKFLNKRGSGGKLTYGISEVSIPQGHKVGEIESPSWLRLQFFRDPEKHVTLLHTQVLPVGKYYHLLNRSINRSPNADAFIFVHGFNVSFEAAALRTAQIAHDLQFRGAPILYSWSSRATLSGYMADEAAIEVGTKLFQRFLTDVGLRTRAKTLHVIAHSMGNRALLLALERLATSSARPTINNVILAAPDIDAQRFYQIAEAVRGYPSRVTLYASSKDKAIKASMKLHQAPRAGESGENIVIAPSVDTVDASNVDTDFLGHAQFADRRELLGDIFELLSKETPPHQRFALEQKLHRLGKYWAFRR